MLATLIGCGGSKKGGEEPSYESSKLTYGSYISNWSEMEYIDLESRMLSTGKYHNETFLLVISPTNGCGCWTNFQPVLKEFISSTKYHVYEIKITEFDENVKFGLNMKQGTVSFAIIKAGKIVKQYNSNSQQPLFESAKAVQTEVKKWIKNPEIFYVDEEILVNQISSSERVVVEYSRSECGDCQYVNPNVLWQYTNKHSLKTKVLIIDIEKLRSDATAYQRFKDQHFLSKKENADYGYGDGVVPTIQCYENGSLVDAAVFFNDTVSVVAGQYVVSESYYTDTRKEKLHYLNGVETTVLQNKILSEDEVKIYTNDKGEAVYWAWKQEYAARFHKPLYEAFLNTYTLK